MKHNSPSILSIVLLIILLFIILIIHNDPTLWILSYINVVYFNFISIGSLLFLNIQYATKSEWSKSLIPIILSISSFTPYGCIILLLFLIMNAFGLIKIFKWLNIYCLNNFNNNIINKCMFHSYFYILRNFIIISTIIYLYFYLNKIINKKNIHNNVYKTSIIFLIFFYVISTFISWDWIMFINTHWNNAIFSWYLLSSYITCGISIITIYYILLNKEKKINNFNSNHLHDLSNYIFSGSLLWGYLWFCQFLFYWYSNIPEEIIFFVNRNNYILIIIILLNIVVPFLLINKKFKKNKKIVFIISIIILVGHYLNINYIILPEEKNIKLKNIYNIIPIVIITIIFIMIINRKINKLIKNKKLLF